MRDCGSYLQHDRVRGTVAQNITALDPCGAPITQSTRTLIAMKALRSSLGISGAKQRTTCSQSSAECSATGASGAECSRLGRAATRAQSLGAPPSTAIPVKKVETGDPLCAGLGIYRWSPEDR